MLRKDIKIFAYNPASESAKALSEALGVKRLKHEGSRWTPNNQSVVINWGYSGDLIPNTRVINPPSAVRTVSNKLTFFQTVGDPDLNLTVEWTDSQLEAQEWSDEGSAVVVRTILNGHSGEGIQIIEAGEQVPEAPLYTKYMKKLTEFRIHCGIDRTGEVWIFDTQQKKRKTDVPDDEVNWKVRNLAGGFIYARDNVTAPREVNDVAINMMTQLDREVGLTFGAIDVIFNSRSNEARVLEVNTAPGLTGTTVENYKQYFETYLDL